MLDRNSIIKNIEQKASAGHVWDLIVIGGGATGLGSAVDAASRGLDVLLLEAHDFAKGTSSRATKLAHGGVRYLAQGNISLVREALEERGRMLRNAPNLVKPLAFVIPVKSWFEKMFYWIGLKVYDLLAGRLGIGPTRMMNLAQVVGALPTLNRRHLAGGVRYFDAQFDDARLAIALMKTLFAQGGQALNYCAVTGFEKQDERIAAVKVQDRFGAHAMSLKAKAFINATGVWVDDLRRLDNPSTLSMLSPSQGVHVVVDRSFHPATDALLVPKTSDGRVLFVVPWLGKTLIGTTDTPRRDAPTEPKPLDGEVDFVLQTAAQYLSPAPSRSDVRSVFVGLRPLVGAAPNGNTKSISREHTIVTDPSGLVTITGGKWTTYRSMAEEVVDLVCKQRGWHGRPCQTTELRLKDSLPAQADGTRLDAALDLTEQDIQLAVTEELAVTIEDVLARRNRALFLDSAAARRCIPAVRRVLAQRLGYSEAQLDEQERHFQALCDQYAG
ncbi:MAG: FAD-dependent oxidoreductase [Limnobacter sp.]|uniref:glycerol-3-phosphate dehydrogenase/oxidase n=1 Tax=Limnobacter sp. TaxID=2003368 RepID=UPI00391DE84C